MFKLSDGTLSQNLRKTFKKLMIDTGLLTCPLTGQNRTLYSFRHTYATFALLNDGMDIHTLAIQMGISIAMIERHYSHLTPWLRKEILIGKRYELSREEFDEFTETPWKKDCRHSLQRTQRSAMWTKLLSVSKIFVSLELLCVSIKTLPKKYVSETIYT